MRFLLLILAAGLVARPAAAQDASATDTLRLDAQGAVRMALERGVEAEILRQDVAFARAQVGVARSYALPNLDLDATYRRNIKRPVIFFPSQDNEDEIVSIELGEDNEYQASLLLRQPLYSSGRVGSGLRAAKEGAEAARLSGDAEAAAIALEVEKAYYVAQLALEQVKIAEVSLEQARRTADQVGSEVTQGTRPRFELLRAQVEVANRGPVLTLARTRLTIAKEALKRLLGVSLDRPVVLTDELAYEPFPMERDEAVAEALGSRKDLEAARRSVRASEAEMHARGANDLPLLYLNGSYTWQGQTSDGLFPGDRETAQSLALGLSLSWPILDGFQNRYLTRQAKARFRKAEFQLRLAEDGVRLAVRSAWARTRSVEEELEGTEETVGLASEAYDLARIRYESGLSTQLEVFDAELALTQARLTHAEALYRYRVALAELENHLGRSPALPEKEGS
jgi:outer membrane protein